MLMVLFKGLLAGIIVGFVTGSIRSWVDRFFLVLLLTGLVVHRLWTEKLNRVVAMVISPLLILVCIKFVLMSWH